MTEYHLKFMREWIQAEIKAAIADSQPGEDGYYGSQGYFEGREADRLFGEVVGMFGRDKQAPSKRLFQTLV